MLGQNLPTYPVRMRHINRTTEMIAGRLREHQAVDQVWYPKFDAQGFYHRLRRPGGGYGGLLSFVPTEPSIHAAMIYDHLRISKGPSLGTNFSLASPHPAGPL